MDIKTRDSAAIINSLSGGVVPSRGLHYIMVGRTEETKQILSELKDVKNGSSIVKFYVGPFGSGKSFIQALIRQIAFKEKFVVTNGDFTPERRLYATDGKARAIYTELMKNLSINTKPEGGALPTILDKWISEIQSSIVSEKGFESIDFEDETFVRCVEDEIVNIVSKMDELTGGYDFSRVLIQYYRGFVQDDTLLQRHALRWLRGEYGTRTEVKKDLGIREMITDDTFYSYLKVMAKFVKQIGYSGLIVNFDEAINLYKIVHPQSRDKNYEAILKIYNDALQGHVEGLYITFGGTPEFLTDERRGLFSYGALKRRLESNPYETKQHRDLAQPVVRLTPLDHNDTFVLLTKLRDIHAVHFKYETEITDDEIEIFLIKEYSRPGAEENLTAGDVIRNFLGALNVLHQNPNYDRTEIFGKKTQDLKPNVSVNSRFSRMEG